MSIPNNINMNTRALGLNIRAERNRKELSQADLAEKVDMSENSINAIERGKQIPSAINLYLIAKILEVDINELFKGID